jgi:hypothetical protein
MPLTDSAVRNVKPSKKSYKLADGPGMSCWWHQNGTSGGDSGAAKRERKAPIPGRSP